MPARDPKNPLVRSRLVTSLMSSRGRLEVVSSGDDLLGQQRRRRRAGDPRITPQGRELLLRMVAGDLMGEFQAELDSISAEDPDLGGAQVPHAG